MTRKRVKYVTNPGEIETVEPTAPVPAPPADEKPPRCGFL